MRITLLRHAETAGNLLKRYVGITDEPLSTEGIARAQCVGQDMSVARVYTSTLKRTQQTARLLYPRAEVVPVKDLGEMNFGSFEGRSAEDMEHDQAYRAWVEGYCEGACPGGESSATFTQRCVAAFLQVLATAEEESTGELCCVVHGGVIRAVMSELALPVKPFFDWRADFCGGYVLVSDEAGKGDRPLRVLETIR